MEMIFNSSKANFMNLKESLKGIDFEKEIYSTVKDFFITTNSEIVIDEDTTWNKSSILHIQAKCIEDVIMYINTTFGKGKILNIYKQIPLLRLFYPKGIIRKVRL